MGASVGAGANVGSCGPADASDVVGGIDVCSPWGEITAALPQPHQQL